MIEDGEVYQSRHVVMKTRQILDTIVLTASALLVAGPAAAVPIPIPEPGTLSIFGLGVGALYLAARHKRRK